MNEQMLFSRFECGDGCWGWRGSLDRDGYGRFGRGWEEGRTVLAHRLVYESIVGPIPEGLTLDHLCRNRACVNPAHLEPVPIGVNVMRGETFGALNAKKTHCPHGHEYDKANTYIDPIGRRHCRSCDKARAPRHRTTVRVG